MGVTVLAGMTRPVAAGAWGVRGVESGDMAEEFVVGEGLLNWSPDERRTGRYGAVTLFGPDTGMPVVPDPVVQDRWGWLIAEVLQVWPDRVLPGLEAPRVGDRLVLGSGTAFTAQVWYQTMGVGVRPDDGRDEEWMDPDFLYRVQTQLVRLHLHCVD